MKFDPTWWLNRAGDIWALIFAASFVLSIVVGIVQDRRGKQFFDTPLLPFMAALHFAWVIPAALFIGVYAVISAPPFVQALCLLVGAGWLWMELRRHKQ